MAYRFPRVVPAVFLCLFASAAQAQSVLKCDIDIKGGDGGWISPVILVLRETPQAEPVVFDAIIKHFKGEPVPARVAVDNKVRTTYAWEVATKDNNLQKARTAYRMTVQKATGAAAITVSIMGYSNQYMAHGACKPA